MITTTIFPGRYVQGQGALSLLAEETKRLASKALIIVDPAVSSLLETLLTADAEVSLTSAPFGGECSDEEIARLTELAKGCAAGAIVGLGGGKALDTAKAVAHALGLPVIIVPTLASTDAPCSALSVIYTTEGAFKRYLLLPRNPDVVLVDSEIILNAPVRFLVSGMGDALSTWFEAEDCRLSGAGNMTGRPGSMTAIALAKLCFETLMADGADAIQAMKDKEVTPALERIIEANTLLSGLGFESGGLSGAHAIHNGLTVLPETHHYWHGEKVAIGTLALIMLTDKPAELKNKAFDFCQAVGLPICLADIGLDTPTDAQLMRVAQQACAPGETIHNIKGGVTPEQVLAAIKAVDAEGRRRKGS
ncbi:MAG: glycerol dehydrogenase [Proteobacteria bacterium]|nr:glycerol dehydrogenase [Pseudomonadota bacterium]